MPEAEKAELGRPCPKAEAVTPRANGAVQPLGALSLAPIDRDELQGSGSPMG
jgi:hypothetical protein